MENDIELANLVKWEYTINNEQPVNTYGKSKDPEIMLRDMKEYVSLLSRDFDTDITCKILEFDSKTSLVTYFTLFVKVYHNYKIMAYVW